MLNIRKTFIYMLIDPRNDEIKYVGKSDHPNQRLKEHIYMRYKKRSHKNNWIIGLIDSGLQPILKVIEEIRYSNWEKRERYWIKYYKKQGYKLTNMTDGGKAGIGIYSIESLRKQRDTINARKKDTILNNCYIGVTYNKKLNNYSSYLTIAGTHTYLGRYETEREAAEVHDLFAILLYGDTTITNFPKGYNYTVIVSRLSKRSIPFFKTYDNYCYAKYGISLENLLLNNVSNKEQLKVVKKFKKDFCKLFNKDESLDNEIFFENFINRLKSGNYMKGKNVI